MSRCRQCRGDAFTHAIFLLLALPLIALAVTPLTPRLTPEAQTQLVDALRRSGFVEVSHNSVLIALTQALGTKPQTGNSTYREPYPHLPEVEVNTRAISAECVAVELAARQLQSNPVAKLRLQGQYCLVGPALWQVREINVAGKIGEEIECSPEPPWLALRWG